MQDDLETTFLERVHDLFFCTENGAMRKRYASYICLEKFEEIRPLLQSVSRRTNPTTVDLDEGFCPAIFRNGARCIRTLPSAASPTRTSSAFWSGHSKNQVGAARLKPGRSACPTLLIVDAQSVKNTDTAALKGYDAG